MCFDRGIFLNSRTTKDGYIETGQSSANLTPTRLTDLRLAVRYLKCRYDFGIEEVTDFLGIAGELVEEAFKDLPCLSCSPEKRQKFASKFNKPEPVLQPEEVRVIPRPKKRKSLAAR